MPRILSVLVAGSGLLLCSPTRAFPQTVSPATARAALLDPQHAFWRQQAPDSFQVRFETTKGAFVVEAHRGWGPRGADRLYNLVRAGFFNDSRFYRVVSRFAQFGIPGDPQIAAVW